MKKIKILVLFILIAGTATAQRRSDIFKADTQITWLGLDFTGAKLIGDREHLGSESDIRHLIEAWNDLLVREAAKFDVAKAIDKKQVTTAIDITKDNNASLDLSTIYSAEQKDYLHLTKNGITEIVSGYDFKGNKGIGLMFNVESFSKPNEEGAIWVTFVVMETKEVLFSERLTAKPGGFGLRNYWSRVVFEIMEKMKKKEFANWSKKSSQ